MKQGKEFLEAFPDGAITCENIVVQCNDCGNLMSVPELGLYVPDDGFEATKQDRRIPWSSAFSGKGRDYIPPCDLRNYYNVY